MYMVDNLSYNEKYISYFQTKYPNVIFHKTPHFSMYNIIRTGHLGIQKADVKPKSLSDIVEMWRATTGLTWTIMGMKKSDSIKRFIMLRDGLLYDAIQMNTKKVYPLTDWKNRTCLAYIKKNKLPPALAYSKDKSNGDIIGDVRYLLWLKENYPSDLQKVIDVFPMTKQILFEHEYKTKI